MIKSDLASLTGFWTGVFDYPSHEEEPVPFSAYLVEEAGGLSGEIIEPNTFAATPDRELFSSVAGDVLAGMVSFVKTYESAPGAGHAVRYDGAVNAARTRIDGFWRIEGDWGGRFVMNRADRREARAVERERRAALHEER